MRQLAHIPVTERSQSAEARRMAMHFGQRLGFSEELVGRIGIAVTEAATNLTKHARQGEILLSTWGKSLELLAVDRGPGMDVEACLKDGFSTAGTLGSGLGAIQRTSDAFDIYSSPAGTVLSAAFGDTAAHFGAARVPKKGETLCGDSWSVVQRNGATWAMVADGLGHGEFAAAAADRAVETFETGRFDSVTGIVEEIHGALRSTRGAAVAVAEIRGSSVNYCGLGNISTVMYSGASNVQMVSMNGTAGIEARKIGMFTYSWRAGAALIMHSDGLQSQWGLERYPGLVRRRPAVVAGTLYRDYNRGRDDVTVLVVRQ